MKKLLLKIRRFFSTQAPSPRPFPGGRGVKKPAILAGAAGLIVLFALAFFLTWQRVDVMLLGYEVRRLETRRATLLREQERLAAANAEAAQLKDVEKKAASELGLQRPNPGQVEVVALPPKVAP